MNKVTVLVLCVTLYFANADVFDENVILFQIPRMRSEFVKQPTTLQVRGVLGLMLSNYEAWSKFTPSAVGLFTGNSNRRPATEHTIRNKNIALAYANNCACKRLIPWRNWDFLWTDIGLDPNNNTRNPESPIGIGNLACDAAFAFLDNDGFNSLGNLPSVTYNRLPFSDYTGYKPVNTPYEIQDLDRWQPLLQANGVNGFSVQQFITPMAGLYKTFAIDVNSVAIDELKDKFRDKPRRFRQKLLDIIEESKNLNDYKKMVAEFFDNKFSSFGAMTGFLATPALDRFVIVETAVNLALVDSIAFMWHIKNLYDSIRPVSAIRKILKDTVVEAWGGPYRGTVTLKGGEWSPYLAVDSHPEYPSGTACLCAAFAEVGRRFNNGSDSFGFAIPRIKGTSLIEPGAVPSSNITIAYSTFTQMVDDCSRSRLWGGVHFVQSVDAAKDACGYIGGRAYDKLMKYVRGESSSPWI